MDNEKQTHLLVIRLSALGDVAMTLPAIYSLARQYPRMEITVLTRPFFARLFMHRPENVRLLEADLKGRHKGATGMLRLLRTLAALRPTHVADLHNVLRSWVIDAFFRMRGVRTEMVDKNRRVRKRLVSGQSKDRQPSYVDRYVEVFARLGFRVRTDFVSLFHRTEAVLPLKLQPNAIGIAPFARYRNKTYPPGKMKEVVRLLTQEGYHVYLFGGKGDESHTLEQWQADCPGCTSLAGRFSLEQELALISRLPLMVTMDSANQHLASLAGTTALTLWGSTTPACGFLGYGQDEANALCLHLPCQPCSIAGGDRCRLHSFACLEGMEPERIVQAVKRLASAQRQKQD